MALFSLSNGYLGSIVMTFGPKMMTNPHEQGQAASLLVKETFNTVGISIKNWFIIQKVKDVSDYQMILYFNHFAENLCPENRIVPTIPKKERLD
jgi:hypothetical protein